MSELPDDDLDDIDEELQALEAATSGGDEEPDEVAELQMDEQAGESAVGRRKQMRDKESFLDRADRNESEMARRRRQFEVSLWLAIREMYPSSTGLKKDMLSSVSRISIHYGLEEINALSRDTIGLKSGLRLGIFKSAHGPGVRDIAKGEPAPG